MLSELHQDDLAHLPRDAVIARCMCLRVCLSANHTPASCLNDCRHHQAINVAWSSMCIGHFRYLKPLYSKSHISDLRIHRKACVAYNFNCHNEAEGVLQVTGITYAETV